MHVHMYMCVHIYMCVHLLGPVGELLLYACAYVHVCAYIHVCAPLGSCRQAAARTASGGAPPGASSLRTGPGSASAAMRTRCVLGELGELSGLLVHCDDERSDPVGAPVELGIVPCQEDPGLFNLRGTAFEESSELRGLHTDVDGDHALDLRV